MLRRMSLGLLVVSAAVGQLTAIVVSRRAPRLWLVFTIGSALCAAGAALVVLFAGGEWEWRGGPAIAGGTLYLRLDALSAFFVVLLSVIDAAGALYATGYWTPRAHPRSAGAGRFWWSVLVFGLALVLTVSNSLHFLVGWEIFTVAAFFLVSLNRSHSTARAAGSLYLNASHAAALALFAFFALLAASTGSWELGPVRDRTELAPLFWLALFGFGLKAGAFPLHIWLPSAHANAPSHVSAFLSGFNLKIGIYGLMRFTGWLPVPSGAGWVVAALGVASAVLGVAFALGQHDLKRLLAYHSVENIGIILIGFGFALISVRADGSLPAWGQLALAGALLHVWNHGLFKSLLFLGAGSVLHATGTCEMSRLGGLWRRMPWTAGLFAIGAIAIAGLPPLNGFISEWLVYLGLLEAALARGATGWAVLPATVLLALTGALALACFVKVCSVVFLGAARSAAAERAHECGLRMRTPMALIAIACVAIAFAPALLWPALQRAIGAWQPSQTAAPVAPGSLVALGAAQVAIAAAGLIAAWALRRRIRSTVRRNVTWDCGYERPAASMQYTAGSFAATITEWFQWILCPRRHTEPLTATFPSAASHHEHTPETVLERVVEPAGAGVIRLANVVRRLQHGHLQSYLLYLLAGVAGLAAIAASGGGQ